MNGKEPNADGVRASDEAIDAELGRTAMRFVDRAGDVCEQDPAERICEEFHNAMAAVMEKHFPTMRGPVGVAPAPAWDCGRPAAPRPATVEDCRKTCTHHITCDQHGCANVGVTRTDDETKR